MNINLSESDSDYMYSIIQKIIDDCGCRMPCSPQEAEAAQIIKNELEKTCDEVIIEPFKCHPRAFLGWIRIDIVLILISLMLFFLTPFCLNCSLIIAIISVIILIIC